MKPFIFLAYFLSSITCAEAYYQVAHVAYNDTLSVRQLPSPNAKKVGELYPYDTGIVIQKCLPQEQSTWCKIILLKDYIYGERAINNGGWVNQYYLKKANNITQNTLHYTKVQNIKANDSLTVREHPTTKSNDVHALAPHATCLPAIRCQIVNTRNWCYVAYSYYRCGDDKTGVHGNKCPVLGWVNSHYLTTDNSSHCKTNTNSLYDLLFAVAQ